MLTICTVSANSATAVGGLMVGDRRNDDPQRQIVAGNITVNGEFDVHHPSASAHSEGNNLIGTASTGFHQAANTTNSSIVRHLPADQPRPGLGNNGGPTQTMALLTGSRAIDKGSNSISGLTIPTTDERGALRTDRGQRRERR